MHVLELTRRKGKPKKRKVHSFMGLAKSQKKRTVMFVGDVGIPESQPAVAASIGTLGKNLRIVMDIVDTDTAASQSSTASAPSLLGLSLLRFAATGEPLTTLSADSHVRHAPSLEPYFQHEGHSGKLITFVKAVSGAYHSLLLLSTGNVLTLTADPADHGTALSLPEGVGVQDIAGGRSHFVLCSDAGTVFTFGWSNEFGQLGDGTMWRVDAPSVSSQDWAPILTDPKMIPGFGITIGAPENQPCIIAVAAGENHSVLLAASRTAIYTCGRGHCGQLGTCRKVELCTSFQNVKCLFGTELRSVAAAGDHTLFLLESGKLIAVGDNTCGTMGTGKLSDSIDPEEALFLTGAAISPKREGRDAADGTQQQRGSPARSNGTMTKSASPGRSARRTLDSKAVSSIKAPYGTVASQLYPRRLYRIPTELRDEEPRVAYVIAGKTATIAVTDDQQLYSCGLRVRPHPKYQRPDAQGALGRFTACSSDATVFGKMTLRRASSAAKGGWIPVVGMGFTAFLDPNNGTVRLQGTIKGPSAASSSNSNLVGAEPLLSSMDRKHSLSSYQTLDDDSIAVCVGSRRVVSCAAVRNGLLLLVEDA